MPRALPGCPGPSRLARAGKPFPARPVACDSNQMPEQQDRAAERVWRALPAGTREALERACRGPTCRRCCSTWPGPGRPGHARRRDAPLAAGPVRPARGRRPAPRRRRREPAVAAAAAEFTGVELSPVRRWAPARAVAPVSQNRVVSHRPGHRGDQRLHQRPRGRGRGPAARPAEGRAARPGGLPSPAARPGLRPRGGGALPPVRPGLQCPGHRFWPHRGQPADPAPGLLAGRAGSPDPAPAAADRAVGLGQPGARRAAGRHRPARAGQPRSAPHRQARTAPAPAGTTPASPC